MRTVAWVVVFCCVAAPARAADDAARAVLDKAIKAVGGNKDLAKLAGVSLKTKGKVDAGGVQVDISGEMSLQGLDRVRWEVEASVMGRSQNATLILNGGKGWASRGDGASDAIPKDGAIVFLNVLRCARLALNPGLLRQPGFKLSPLGELKIGDRETIGLKVTQKGFPDIDLFFDKKTGLPYKTEIRQKEGKQGMEKPHAFLFDGYKSFDGVKQFTKVKFLRDDKTLIEVECSDFKPQEKLDDSLFAKPEKTDSPTRGKAAPVSPRFRLEAVAPKYHDRVRAVLEHPSLHARGPVETFHCKPAAYHWLLDHPDRAVIGWQKMGAKCAAISDRGNGRFGWKDEQGSDVHWDTVLRDSSQRVWYVEGEVWGGATLRKIPLRAVLILHITKGHDTKGRAAIRHEGELILHTDNRLAVQVLGVLAPHAAAQYVGQIQTFFAALAWHLDRHPEKAKALLSDEGSKAISEPLLSSGRGQRPKARPGLVLRPADGGGRRGRLGCAAVILLDTHGSTQLPGVFHRDPADQLIVATARHYDCPLVTLDRLIRGYPHVRLAP